MMFGDGSAASSSSSSRREGERLSIFEREEKLSLERARHVRLMNSTLVGSLVGVGWSYVVEEVADPSGACPEGGGCWTLIVLLALSLVAGVLLIPFAQMALEHRLGAVLARLKLQDAARSAPLREPLTAPLTGASAVLAVERHSIFAPKSASHYGFRRAVASKLLLLLTSAGDSAFVVTSASFLSYLTKELDAGDSYAALFFVELGVCALAAFAAVAVCAFAAKRLRSETDAYRTRLWLLLASHPYYPAAFAISLAVIVVSDPLFARFTIAAVAAQTVCLVVGGRLVSKSCDPPPNDPEQRLAQAATSPLVCASYVGHDGGAVVAAIGVQNVVQLISQSLTLETTLLLYALYTPALLANAHYRHRRRLRRIRVRPKEADSETRFLDVAELWLVTFGFRVPYAMLLAAIWRRFLIKTDQPVLTYFLRFLEQIAIALLLTALVAFLAALVVVLGEIFQRLFPPPAYHDDAAAVSHPDPNRGVLRGLDDNNDDGHVDRSPVVAPRATAVV